MFFFVIDLSPFLYTKNVLTVGIRERVALCVAQLNGYNFSADAMIRPLNIAKVIEMLMEQVSHVTVHTMIAESRTTGHIEVFHFDADADQPIMEIRIVKQVVTKSTDLL
jgi:hypothetical protein